MKRATVLCMIVSAAGLLGCGGDESSKLDESHAKAVVHGFAASYFAFDREDPNPEATRDKMCSYLKDPAEARRLAREESNVSGSESCGNALADALSVEGRAHEVLAAADHVTDVDIAGDRATVSTTSGAWPLEEVDGEWKISNLRFLTTSSRP